MSKKEKRQRRTFAIGLSLGLMTTLTGLALLNPWVGLSAVAIICITFILVVW